MKPNINNLIPNSQRTPEELREMTSKAGKKSGEVRRRKKLFREYACSLLDSKIKNEKIRKQLKDIGVDDELLDNKMLLFVALFKKASSGDVAAFKEIRNLINEDEPIKGVLEVKDPFSGLTTEELKKLINNE